MISKNIEGLHEYNIDEEFWDGREFGLSAMVRLKDEAQWCLYSLESIVQWCDEVVIALQGRQSDKTDEIVYEWSMQYPEKVFVYEYPFNSFPNGPGHDQNVKSSIFDRAYFYNWVQSLTTKSHVMKWDGDMVAHDNLRDIIRSRLDSIEVLRFKGVDICDKHLQYMSVRPYTACEPRIWRVTPKTYWKTGKLCEEFTYGHHDGEALTDPAYLHFKWAKPLESATKAWPKNWRETDHFKRVFQKSQRGDPYRGPVPSVLRCLCPT